MLPFHYRPSAVVGGCMTLGGLALGSLLGGPAVMGYLSPMWVLAGAAVTAIGFLVFLYGIGDEPNRWKMRIALKGLLRGLAAAASTATILWFATPLRGVELATLAFALGAVVFITALARKM